MRMTQPQISYKRHRFPHEIIAHAVWLCVRFNLSLREVEEMLLERGIDVSYGTIRRWTAKFAPRIARSLRRRQARPGDIWYLDEVQVKIAGRKFWLWWAARRLLVKLMKRHGFVLKCAEEFEPYCNSESIEPATLVAVLGAAESLSESMMNGETERQTAEQVLIKIMTSIFAR